MAHALRRLGSASREGQPFHSRGIRRGDWWASCRFCAEAPSKKSRIYPFQSDQEKGIVRLKLQLGSERLSAAVASSEGL